MLRFLTLIILVSDAAAFHTQLRGVVRLSAPLNSICTPPQARRFAFATIRLRAENSQESDSPTILSDEELSARIAAIGLDKQLTDLSTGEEEELSPIEQAKLKSARMGKAALAATASSAISVLNTLEKVCNFRPCYFLDNGLARVNASFFSRLAKKSSRKFKVRPLLRLIHLRF